MSSTVSKTSFNFNHLSSHPSDQKVSPSAERTGLNKSQIPNRSDKSCASKKMAKCVLHSMACLAGLGVIAYKAYQSFYAKDEFKALSLAILSQSPCKTYMPELEGYLLCSDVADTSILNLSNIPSREGIESSRKHAEAGNLAAMHRIKEFQKIVKLPEEEIQSITSQFTAASLERIKQIMEMPNRNSKQTKELVQLLIANKREAEAKLYLKTLEPIDFSDMDFVKHGKEKALLSEKDYQEIVEKFTRILPQTLDQTRMSITTDFIGSGELSGATMAFIVSNYAKAYDKAYEYDSNHKQWQDEALGYHQLAATAGNAESMKHLREKHSTLPRFKEIDATYKEIHGRAASKSLDLLKEKDDGRSSRALSLFARECANAGDAEKAFVTYIHLAKSGSETAMLMLEQVNRQHPIPMMEVIRESYKKNHIQ